MPDRSLSSRVLRAFGRLLRRLTIGFGALILVFYYSGDWILAVWPYPACSDGQNHAWQMPKATSPRSRSVVAS